jgi:hypothetical protein
MNKLFIYRWKVALSSLPTPHPLANTAIIATSPSSLFVSLLSEWQIEALPVRSSRATRGWGQFRLEQYNIVSGGLWTVR